MWELVGKGLTALANLPLHRRVQIVACLAFLGVSGLGAISFGLIPGVPGFVRSDAFEQLTSTVRNSSIDQAEDAILRLREQQCNEQQVKDDSPAAQKLRAMYARALANDMTRYRDLKGMPFEEPPCSDF